VQKLRGKEAPRFVGPFSCAKSAAQWFRANPEGREVVDLSAAAYGRFVLVPYLSE